MPNPEAVRCDLKVVSVPAFFRKLKTFRMTDTTKETIRAGSELMFDIWNVSKYMTQVAIAVGVEYAVGWGVTRKDGRATQFEMKPGTKLIVDFILQDPDSVKQSQEKGYFDWRWGIGVVIFEKLSGDELWQPVRDPVARTDLRINIHTIGYGPVD